MKEVRQTEEFSDWLMRLRDHSAAGRIATALVKLKYGLGDIEPIGEGVSELRLHFGPGYRVYFVERGRTLIIVISGGDKGSQSRDIKEAKRIAKLLE